MLPEYPEWLFCESTTGERQFVFHTVAPRFLGELFDEDDSDLARDAILDSLSVGLDNGQTMANIVFLLDEGQEPVLGPELVRALNGALAEYDSRPDASAVED